MSDYAIGHQAARGFLLFSRNMKLLPTSDLYISFWREIIANVALLITFLSNGIIGRISAKWSKGADVAKCDSDHRKVIDIKCKRIYVLAHKRT